ncbi:Transcriptional regulatory protein WalR [Thermoflexales bacterium]|nr:Transcriptional regulatory protein WalR [Thermoflexales bacterium]
MSKILVIDDDTGIRNNLTELLEAEGYEVSSAEDGRRGIQQVRLTLPDLVICDIMMPELDGYGVLTELREDPVTATIPFIFLTAKIENSDLRQGMNLGADDYLVKPFTRTQLLMAIATRLRKQTVITQRLKAKMDDLRNSIALALPHELRTPLAGISGFSELLLEGAASMPPQEIQAIAHNIHASAQRLQDLILNFLLYAELAIASRDPDYANALKDQGPCYVESIIAEVARQQAQQADRQSDLQLDLERSLVKIGTVYLAKLSKELVRNALKFSKPGTPVHILGRRNEHSYILSFEDRGRGMTAEQIADMGAYLQFERNRYEQQGQGLGLAIAKWLAELHAGGLNIESAYGQGTTVQVRLPVFSDGTPVDTPHFLA